MRAGGARITPVGGKADGAPSGRRDVSGHALQARGKWRHEGEGENGGKGEAIRHSCKATSKV